MRQLGRIDRSQNRLRFFAETDFGVHCYGATKIVLGSGVDGTMATAILVDLYDMELVNLLLNC